jgi:hypothetical protein
MAASGTGGASGGGSGGGAAGSQGGSTGGAGAMNDAGSTAGTGGTSSAGGPIILSFATNVMTLTPVDQLIFTAVVTHPNGIAQIVGGTLSDPDGGTYGAFQVSTVAGAYSLTLAWKDLQTVKDITTARGGTSRVFRAQFFDQSARSISRDVTIKLWCGNTSPNQAICAGVCKDLDTDVSNCNSCGNLCSKWGADHHLESLSMECRAAKCQGPYLSTQRDSCQNICAGLGTTCARANSDWRALCGNGRDTETCDAVPPASKPAGCSSTETKVFSDMWCICGE